MAKMNRDDARGSDDDFAGVGDEPTIKARYAGTCATCGQPFEVGAPIASTIVDKKPTYHHGACRYSASAFLREHDEAAPSMQSSTRLCDARTKKGKPCSNTPQKGERYCGPHVTQAIARGEAS